jgi:hypothetical protein
VVLRTSNDTRTRAPIDHDAAAIARASVEPDLP